MKMSTVNVWKNRLWFVPVLLSFWVLNQVESGEVSMCIGSKENEEFLMVTIDNNFYCMLSTVPVANKFFFSDLNHTEKGPHPPNPPSTPEGTGNEYTFNNLVTSSRRGRRKWVRGRERLPYPQSFTHFLLIIRLINWPMEDFGSQVKKVPSRYKSILLFNPFRGLK